MSIPESFWLYFDIFWVFFKISLISLGGVFGVLPELERMVVTERHWITHDDFIQSYVLGQFVPGPNMAMCSRIGYMVAGAPGWLAAFIGIYLGPLLTMFITFWWFHSHRSNPTVKRMEIALRPLVLGLMASATIQLFVHQSLAHWMTAIMLSAIFLWLHVAKKVGPIAIMLLFGFTWSAIHMIIFA